MKEYMKGIYSFMKANFLNKLRNTNNQKKKEGKICKTQKIILMKILN